MYLLYRLGYSSNVRALSKRLRVRVRAASDLRSFELRAFRPMSCIKCFTQQMRDADSDADRCHRVILVIKPQIR